MSEEFLPVLTKQDFVGRYKAGEFGNASPTWSSFGEFLLLAEKYLYPERIPGFYHLRNRVAGGATHYNLHWSACVAKWIEQEDKRQWYASEMAPHQHNLIQGEVCQTHPGSGRYGLDLTYTLVKDCPMREAMAKGQQHTSGLKAQFMLKYYLCPNSYEWLNELLNRYPYHVVEFSTFSVKWGTLFPLYNTVFWEVRSY